MNKIITSLIKELRERTGAGIIDCKKALIESDGNIELAIKKMRKSGAIKVEKKEWKIAAEGVVLTKIEDDFGFILEVNCQTDFVAKHASFLSFSKKILELAISKENDNINSLKEQFEEERSWLSSRMGENINIRRVSSLKGPALGSYQHGTRIGVLVSIKGSDRNIIKKIAMHIAASNPEFIDPKNIPSERIEKEYLTQLEVEMETEKVQKIAEKKAKDYVKNFISKVSLISQPFIMNPEKTVFQLLKENNIGVIDFIRFQVGEGMKKKEINFAEEVAILSKQF